MYTKMDLIENNKMNEILRINQVKVRSFNIARAKKNKRDKIITNVLMMASSSIFIIGLMYLIAVIENLRF